MELNRVTLADDSVPVQNVLISVFDKSGLDTLVSGLVSINAGLRIFSTGGTFAAIRDILGDTASERLTQIAEYTGQPEMQGGLVKTLDFRIYLGLLSETYNSSHTADLKRTRSVEFDMTVVNLYPFRDVTAKSGISIEDARTNIDIGGPAMLRASAKNFLRILPVCDPGDYTDVLSALSTNGGASTLGLRYRYAAKAFRHTAEYDTAVAEYLGAHRPGKDLYQLSARAGVEDRSQDGDSRDKPTKGASGVD